MNPVPNQMEVPSALWTAVMTPPIDRSGMANQMPPPTDPCQTFVRGWVEHPPDVADAHHAEAARAR